VQLLVADAPVHRRGSAGGAVRRPTRLKAALSRRDLPTRWNPCHMALAIGRTRKWRLPLAQSLQLAPQGGVT